jgi:hypothetical protein
MNSKAVTLSLPGYPSQHCKIESGDILTREDLRAIRVLAAHFILTKKTDFSTARRVWVTLAIDGGGLCDGTMHAAWAAPAVDLAAYWCRSNTAALEAVHTRADTLKKVAVVEVAPLPDECNDWVHIAARL